jgi:hypothetical protein
MIRAWDAIIIGGLLLVSYAQAQQAGKPDAGALLKTAAAAMGFGKSEDRGVFRQWLGRLPGASLERR